MKFRQQKRKLNKYPEPTLFERIKAWGILLCAIIWVCFFWWCAYKLAF